MSLIESQEIRWLESQSTSREDTVRGEWNSRLYQYIDVVEGTGEALEGRNAKRRG